MILANQCDFCKLSETRNLIVWGEGPSYSRIMFVGQDPGAQEDATGVPFYHEAPAGQEFDRLLETAGLSRENVYVTNSCKCHTPGDRGPTHDELVACRPWLLTEIARIRPKVIVPMGGPATKNLLGDVELEVVHGIPFEVTFPEIGVTSLVVPSYHPAGGLRNSDFALKAVTDFAAVAATLRGKLTPLHFKDPLSGGEHYGILRSPEEVREALAHNPKFIAIDTETYDWNYTPYCTQFSTAPGSGFMIYATDAKSLAIIADYVARPGVITIIHNSLFDLFVLHKLGIYPAKVHDTMIMAYLLQTEPLGLKALAFRLWGMHMKEYDLMVAHVSADLAETYLRHVQEFEWPDPDKVLQIKQDGTVHYKQPQNIRKIVKRIFDDFEKGRIGRDDFWTRWHNLDEEETSRGLIEEMMGPMREGNLSMIPEEEAMWYACRDPDATIRIYPYLISQIEERGMLEVLDLDLSIIPMVMDMMETGITLIPEELEKLKVYFQKRMDELYAKIKPMAGKDINLRSHIQVGDLLFNKFRLHHRFHIKLKKGKLSTDDKTMGKMVALHPVVPLIREWKGLNSLQTKYVNTLPGWVQSDGRIHARISTTRTATGRLCVHPDTPIEAPRDMLKYPNGIPVRELREGDFVYSFDWTRELVIRKVLWVGPTQVKPTVTIRYRASIDSPVMELVASPEHLVRLYDGTWKHAGKLKPGDRLLCMVRRHKHGQGYFSFYSHSKNRGNGSTGGGKIKEHRFIYSQVYENGDPLSSRTIIHHTDGRPSNNHPTNLQKAVSIAEHQTLHRMTIPEYEHAIESGVGKKGEIIKETTKAAYKRRLRNLKREQQGLVGVNHIVISVEPGLPMQLWDLEVEDTHTFIGNEVALHNSASNPNIMNQPTRSEDGKAIRKCYTAGAGNVFVSNDLSQIEMRVLADQSGDPLLLDIFRAGKDIHSITASNIFKVPIEQLDEMKHRYPSKRVGFGVVYGITAEGLQEQLLMIGLDPNYWTKAKCQELIDEWFALYHDVEVYMQDLVSFALRHGYVEDMFGRRRYLEAIHSSSKRARSEAARQAGNMPIQCLPASTRVLTPKGYVRIGDFTEGRVWTGNAWARARRISKGTGQLVNLYTDDGFIFTCDTKHRLLVQDGAWSKWTKVVDLVPGAVLRGTPQEAPLGEKLEDPEFWYWVGRYYGDGYMPNLKKGQVRPMTGRPGNWSRSYVEWAFGGTKKEDVKDLMSYLEKTGFKPKLEVQHKRNSVVLRVRDYRFNKRMQELGIEPNQVSWTKRFANTVFTLSKDRREALVQGYYDADGTTRKRYANGRTATAITSVNRGLLQDTALLLRSLGKRSYIKGPYRTDDPEHRPFYRLFIHEDAYVPKRVVKVEILNEKEKVFTLSVEHITHAFDSEGVISKNSGAAGIFKAGMRNLIPIYKDFLARGYYIRPVLPIHDDLVFEVEEDLVNLWAPLQQDCMEHAVTLKVPIKSDAKVGKIWGAMEKYKW